jgi:PHD/YefM family antitoxin component YafN of YafNO toxin-antitoxin module
MKIAKKKTTKYKATSPRPHFVVDTNGKKTGVLLSLKRYEQLLEDLNDLAIVAERRNEASISLKDMKRRLQER